MENTTDDDVGRRVGDNLNQLREQWSERTHEIREAIGSYVDENPLAAVGIAFGIGYLLSGALVSRTTLRAASFGGRVLLGGVLKQLVAGIGPGMLVASLFGGREPTQPQREGNGNPQR
jgi:hypothetical protein